MSSKWSPWQRATGQVDIGVMASDVRNIPYDTSQLVLCFHLAVFHISQKTKLDDFYFLSYFQHFHRPFPKKIQQGDGNPATVKYGKSLWG